MAAAAHMLTAFVGGELDPLMAGRVDTDQYVFGLKLCENWVCINEGPLVKRPGFAYVCDADPTSSWLSRFRFSITQDYVLEWGEAQLRFHTNGGRIETSPGVAYEVAVPYAADEAAMLSTQQSYDRLYIDHSAHPPARLSRTGATTFSYDVSPLTGGPFIDQNIDESVTMTASGTAVGASVTITASAAQFSAAHVGALIRLEAADFSDLKAWEAGMDAVAIGDIVRSDGKAYQAETLGATGTVQPIHSSGSEWDGQLKNDKLNAKGPYGVKWKYLHGRFGIVKITGFTNATTVTATVISRLPASIAASGTWRWSHGAFSNARGWPSLVVNWAGRQMHVKEFDLFGSVVGDYLNHATHTPGGLLTADMAFRRTLATDNPPLWVAGDNKRLLLGTATAEIGVGAINGALAVSGDNVSAEPQSYYGSALVRPEQIGTETMFVERGGRRIRSAGYDFGRDRYVAPDLTATARHVTRGGVVQFAYAQVPYALLYAVRGDGQLAVHAVSRAEIKGFSRIVAGGAGRVLSAVVNAAPDGGADELWLLVERQRADGLKREIWRQAAWRETGDAQADAFFVDAGMQWQASAGQTHFTGATHLAGEAIAVLANGGVVPGVVVAGDGSFDLPATAVPAHDFIVTAGLPYTATAIPMPPSPNVGGRPARGLKMRIIKVVLRVLETVGIRLGAPGGSPEEVIHRPANAPMDAPIPLFTGDTLGGHVDATFDREGLIQFISSDPLPAIVSAAMLKIDVDMADA